MTRSKGGGGRPRGEDRNARLDEEIRFHIGQRVLRASASRLDTVSLNWSGALFSLAVSSVSALALSLVTAAGHRRVNLALPCWSPPAEERAHGASCGCPCS